MCQNKKRKVQLPFLYLSFKSFKILKRNTHVLVVNCTLLLTVLTTTSENSGRESITVLFNFILFNFIYLVQFCIEDPYIPYNYLLWINYLRITDVHRTVFLVLWLLGVSVSVLQRWMDNWKWIPISTPRLCIVRLPIPLQSSRFLLVRLRVGSKGYTCLRRISSDPKFILSSL